MSHNAYIPTGGGGGGGGGEVTPHTHTQIPRLGLRKP